MSKPSQNEEIYYSMKQQHTTHSLQRNHTAARNNSALLLFDYYPSGDLAQTESRSISDVPLLSVPFVKLSFTYDAAGNRASVSEDFNLPAPDGSPAPEELPADAAEITPVTTSYTYDPAGRISTISDNTLTTFNYDGHGRRSQMRRSYLNLDHVTRYEYNSSGLLHSIAHHAPDTSLINQFAYGYDAAGRRTSMATRDYNAAYTYDDLDRLTAAAYSAFQDKPGGTITHAMIPDEDFTYDKNGNRTALLKDPGPGQGEDVSVSYTHDAPVNRLTSDGTWTYLFDHNGNVVRKSSIADPDHLYDDFHYNFQNKLVRHAELWGHLAN